MLTHVHLAPLVPELVSRRALLLFVSTVLLLGISVLSDAAIEGYDFESAEKETRFYDMIEELRCPKCQNQNIAGSNAPLAKDLKDRVYRLMQEGRSDDEINRYMVDRYGDFITYRPPLKPLTWFLWFGPLVIFIIAASSLLLYVARKRTRKSVPLSDAEKQRLDQVLAQYDNKPNGE